MSRKCRISYRYACASPLGLFEADFINKHVFYENPYRLFQNSLSHSFIYIFIYCKENKKEKIYRETSGKHA